MSKNGFIWLSKISIAIIIRTSNDKAHIEWLSFTERA